MSVNPDLVHGIDSAEGIALWAKQTTFVSLREMKPRGPYLTFSDVPVVPGVSEDAESGEVAQTMISYNQNKQRRLGFDPSRGRSFWGKQSLGLVDLKAPGPIRISKSMTSKIPRVDSFADFKKGSWTIEEEDPVPVKLSLEDLLRGAEAVAGPTPPEPQLNNLIKEVVEEAANEEVVEEAANEEVVEEAVNEEVVEEAANEEVVEEAANEEVVEEAANEEAVEEETNEDVTKEEETMDDVVEEETMEEEEEEEEEEAIEEEIIEEEANQEQAEPL